LTGRSGEERLWSARFFDFTVRRLAVQGETLRVPASERLGRHETGFRWVEGWLVFDRAESQVRLEWKNGKTEVVTRIERDEQFSRRFRDDWRDDKIHEFYNLRISITDSDYLEGQYWNQTVFHGEKPEPEPVNLAQAMIDFRRGVSPQLPPRERRPEPEPAENWLDLLKRWLPWG
jgi:hypothetical protein